MTAQKIFIEKNDNPRDLPDTKKLGFGKYFSDHMFMANFSVDKGWYSPRIVPHENMSLDPAACVLHYGQALFEGLKAFRQKDGSVAVFRPEFNWKRMFEGCGRLCMEPPPRNIFVEGIKKLIEIDQTWVPDEDMSALYIRPTLIGTEGFLGIRPSNEYLFFIIASPVGPYYAEGINPVKIWVERNFLRAAPGGLGQTKAAANYAGSLKASQRAKVKGYTQVLWLDVNKENIEEVGTMNVFFVLKDEIVTPSLDGTILGGGIRECAIQLLRENGYAVSERKLSLSELRNAHEQGTLKECFGTGTAAVVSPVGELASDDWKIEINSGKTGKVTEMLFKELTDIQYGRADDRFHWLENIC